LPRAAEFGIMREKFIQFGIIFVFGLVHFYPFFSGKTLIPKGETQVFLTCMCKTLKVFSAIDRLDIPERP
jgi:hypothetical protein